MTQRTGTRRVAREFAYPIVVIIFNIDQKIRCFQFNFAYCDKVHSVRGRACLRHHILCKASGVAARITGVAEYRLVASARIACVDR